MKKINIKSSKKLGLGTPCPIAKLYIKPDGSTIRRDTKKIGIVCTTCLPELVINDPVKPERLLIR